VNIFDDSKSFGFNITSSQSYFQYQHIEECVVPIINDIKLYKNEGSIEKKVDLKPKIEATKGLNRKVNCKIYIPDSDLFLEKEHSGIKSVKDACMRITHDNDERENNLDKLKTQSEVKEDSKNADILTNCSTPPKRKGLALRADVMNKNIFRAFRRECKSLFIIFTKEQGLSNSRSRRIFKSNVRRFSEDLLTKTTINWQARSDFNFQLFTKYLGLFISVWFVKKSMNDEGDGEKIACFNDILYSYSHKKFYDFLKLTEVSTLMKIVFGIVPINMFTGKHHTLSVNAARYQEHIKKVMKEI